MINRNIIQKKINSKKAKLSMLCLAISSLVVGCNVQKQESVAELKPVNTSAASSSLDIWPVLDIAVKPDEKIEAKVVALLATMSLEQKVAQMIQPEIRDITVEDMRKYGFGSYLNGGGALPLDGDLY